MAKLDTCYAIIDAASEPDVFTMLDEFDPPASCLYSEPIQPEIAELAPYLVEATPEVRKWLSQRDTPWGIYVYTQATMRELRQHLRKYLMVMIPGQDKPVFWRYYDPRNVWDVLRTFDNWRLHTFLGPIKKLETQLWGEHEESDFELERRRYPESVKQSGKLMKFSQTQYERINKRFQTGFVKKLIVYFAESSLNMEDADSFQNEKEILSKTMRNPKLCYEKEIRYFSEARLLIAENMAWNLFDYCKLNRIDDELSFQQLGYLLSMHKIKDFTAIPTEWLSDLDDDGSPGDYRVSSLLIKILGSLPVFNKEGVR